MPRATVATPLYLVCTQHLLVSSIVAAMASPTSIQRHILFDAERALPPSSFQVSSSTLQAMLGMIYVAEAEGALRGQQQRLSSLGDLRVNLQTAGFRPLTVRDSALSRALNEGYLNRLSLVPLLDSLDESLCEEDDGCASDDQAIYGGRVLVYCRGHSIELTRGRLLLPKIDYLLATVLANVVRPIFHAARYLDRGVRRVTIRERRFIRRVRRRMGAVRTDSSLPRKRTTGSLKLTRYGGGSAAMDADALSAFTQPLAEATGSSANRSVVSLLERVTIADVFDERQRTGGLLEALLASCELAEPTYREIVLVWRPRPDAKNSQSARGSSGRWRPWRKKRLSLVPSVPLSRSERLRAWLRQPSTRATRSPLVPPPSPPLEMRLFKDVPIANFEAVLPSSRLVFRPADAVRLDVLSLFSIASALATVRYTALSTRIVAVAAVLVTAP